MILTLGSASVLWVKWGNIPLVPGGHTAVDRPVLSVLLSRAGTKLLFRFTDDARSRLRDPRCPLVVSTHTPASATQ